MGGYERNPAPWWLDGVPPTSTAGCSRPTGRGSRRSWPARSGACRRSPTPASRDDQRPEGFTPDNEFILGKSDVRGFFVAAGFCAHGIAGAGGIGRQVASLDRRRRARARPVAHGHPAVRRPALAVARVDARPDDRGLLDLLRHPLPERGAPGRPAAADVAHLRAAQAAGRGLRREERAGSGRTGSSPTPTTRASAGGWRSRPVGPAAGRASTGARRSRRRRWRPAGRRDLRRDELRQDRGHRERRRGVPSAAVRERGRRPGRARRLHVDAELARRDRDRPDRDPRRAGRYLLVTGTAFGEHDLGWLRKHLPADGGVLVNDITSGRVCFGLWGPGARDLLAPLTTDDLSNEAFPFMTARAITVGRVPVYALRVTYVGELGWELYAQRSTAARSGTRSGRPAASTASSPPATGRSTRCGSRRATASGRWTSRPTRTRSRPAWGSPSASTRRRSSWPGCARRREGGGPGKRLRCLRPRRPAPVCLGNEPVSVGGAVVGRVTSGG